MEPDLHCVAQTAELGEQLAGTANGASRWVLAELPLPWPKPILAHPDLIDIDDRAVLSSAASRTLAIADESTSATSPTRRVIVYEADPAQPFAGFRGTETIVAAEDLVPALLAASSGGLDGTPIDDTTDVLICTQGSHDRCCGRYGTDLYLEALKRFASTDDRPRPRFWRTSHTGGHRFAPTGITFPDGLAWAGLDLDFLAAHQSGDLDPTTVAAHLRGCVAIPDRATQVADAAAGVDLGLEWFTAPRAWHHDGNHVTFDAPTRGERRSVTVESGRTLPVPVCMAPLDEARKTTTELVATSVTVTRT